MIPLPDAGSDRHVERLEGAGRVVLREERHAHVLTHPLDVRAIEPHLVADSAEQSLVVRNGLIGHEPVAATGVVARERDRGPQRTEASYSENEDMENEDMNLEDEDESMRRNRQGEAQE